MRNKLFKYIPNKKVFDTLKISSNELDSGYIIGNSIETIGTPEILWENICFIEEEKLIWTHGSFYNQDDYIPFTDEEINLMMPTE